MPNVTCEKLSKIQDALVSEAVALYDSKKVWEFWEAMGALDVFLSVKKALNCNRHKG